MKRFDIIIIGAGSTGLILAKLLELSGFSVLILEKRAKRGFHSRAIGIHPPGLQILEEIGILDEFLRQGVTITSGVAHVGSKKIGELTLASGRESYDRILTIPQYKTEELLENSLQHTAILRGRTLSSLEQQNKGVHIEVTSDDKKEDFECSILIGADGMHSTVRNLIGVRWSGKTYPFKYAMADMTDNTEFGSQAAIFLSSEGLTESFPLPGGIRRWVLNHKNDRIDHDTFFKSIFYRTGVIPNSTTISMFSEFEIHQYRAENMFLGNVILAGDALGVMSPIGGQAMSLHWFQAKELVQKLITFTNDRGVNRIRVPIGELNVLQKKHLSRLERFSTRSHFNTVIGLPGKPDWLIKGIAKLVLTQGFKNYWSRRFAMKDLK
jgi:2-polyprenyl-6-methoxyphenol hydroxylase-like FAD-dependent oxidoreductase